MRHLTPREMHTLRLLQDLSRLHALEARDAWLQKRHGTAQYLLDIAESIKDTARRYYLRRIG